MHFGLVTIHLEVQRLLEERCLLEGGAYFNVDTLRCGAC